MKPLVPSVYTFMATLFISAVLCFCLLSSSYCTVSLQDCFVQLTREGKKQKDDPPLVIVGFLILALLQACLSQSIAIIFSFVKGC